MNAGGSSAYSKKIFSALGCTATHAEMRNSVLQLVTAAPANPPSKTSDPAVDLVAHYIKPCKNGGLESCVIVVDLARRFDVLALAQQVGEPDLADSLSRLQLVHCSCPEALFCTLETLLLNVVPVALLVVYAAPMHRWHSPQGSLQMARLQELATAHGARLCTTMPTVRL
ncbi:uncharacterized protein LOC144098384 [Amblyomma americanum]